MKRHIAVAFAVLTLAAALVTAYAKEGAIQCANLIYGGTHTSVCFSDEFLSVAQKATTIATERRFKSVKLSSDELFSYPFVMMTGESEFRFTDAERKNLKSYLEKGGFLLASAGCSNKDWDKSFRREMKSIFGETNKLSRISMEHPVFRTVYTIDRLKLTHGGEDGILEGVEIGGKLAVIYSAQGLNDTAHTEGCCCCGGNEVGNSLEMNVNIFVHTMLH